jgi:hypothetical protein
VLGSKGEEKMTERTHGRLAMYKKMHDSCVAELGKTNPTRPMGFVWRVGPNEPTRGVLFPARV